MVTVIKIFNTLFDELIDLLIKAYAFHLPSEVQQIVGI